MKDNYKPASILPVFSKLYAKFLKYPKFLKIFYQKTNVYLGKATTHIDASCLLAILQKQQRSEDSRKAFSAILTDVSKAFNFLDHELQLRI